MGVRSRSWSVSGRARRRTPRVYDQEVVAALIKLWHHFGYLCGKRLAATLRLWLPNYERWDARSKRKIALTPELRAKLVRISPGNHRFGCCAPRNAN